MTDRNAIWQKLSDHQADIADLKMVDLWDDPAARFRRYSAQMDDLVLDYSKHRVTEDTVALLVSLAEAAGVEQARDAMFSGQPINSTEGRAVLHSALRSRSAEPLMVHGIDVREEIAAVRAQVADFARAVRGGTFTSVSGAPFTDVVNIGIGGSDLGPAMTTAALAPYADGPALHFVSNVDGAHLADTVRNLDAGTTLFLIASKTFTTAETMLNAENAKQWVAEHIGAEDAGSHFAALSTNLEAAAAFGIPADRVFGFWDWVGGRYSIWSAIGLPLTLAIGPDDFDRFLDGAHQADQHFQEAPLDQNIPVIMALLGIWYRNFFGYGSHAILPYDQRLNRFAAYLQQLDMESNGKRVSLDGEPVAVATGPVIWGEPGTNGQHAFHQLLHQGTDIIPADILVAANAHEQDRTNHELLLSNAFAQSEALMVGRSEEEARAVLIAGGMKETEATALAPHKIFPGNRPTSTLLYRKLDPLSLGRLIALYEHKVFVQGVIWQINSFDQMGVELGKELAKSLLPAVQGKKTQSGLSTPIVDAARSLLQS